MTNLEMMTGTEIVSSWEKHYKAATVALQNFMDCINEEPMSESVNPDDLSELFSVARFSNPEAFAQLVMENLQDTMELGPDNFTEAEKLWWMRVGVHMGPDYIAKFRKIGAWMEKTESFR